MSYTAPPGSSIRTIPGWGQIVFGPDGRLLGRVPPGNGSDYLQNRGGHGRGNRGGYGGMGGFRSTTIQTIGGRGGLGAMGGGGMGAGNGGPMIIFDGVPLNGTGGGGMGGGNGGPMIIVNGVPLNGTGGGGYGGGYSWNGTSSWPGFPTGRDLGTGGGWGSPGHGGYGGGHGGGRGGHGPIFRPVDPIRDFVPGGPGGFNPNGNYPGVPIQGPPNFGSLPGPGGVVRKKLRDAPEKVRKENLPADGKDCSICYQAFWEKVDGGEAEVPVKLRSCGHIFGERCLNEWVQTSNNCPTCRKEFVAVRAM